MVFALTRQTCTKYKKILKAASPSLSEVKTSPSSHREIFAAFCSCWSSKFKDMKEPLEKTKRGSVNAKWTYKQKAIFSVGGKLLALDKQYKEVSDTDC